MIVKAAFFDQFQDWLSRIAPPLLGSSDSPYDGIKAAITQNRRLHFEGVFFGCNSAVLFADFNQIKTLRIPQVPVVISNGGRPFWISIKNHLNELSKFTKEYSHIADINNLKIICIVINHVYIFE